jgi:multicomponent Na+:H+ antiporter subunit F
MAVLFLVLAIFLAFLVAVCGIRVWRGPTLFDRLIAAGLIGTNTLLLLVLIGFIYGRPDMFVDLAITYAMLNFVGVIVIGKYLEAKKERSP